MKTNNATKSFEMFNTVQGAHLGAYDARDVNQALFLLARDAGYKSLTQAAKGGAFDLDELAVKAGATVWLRKRGTWTASQTL